MNAIQILEQLSTLNTQEGYHAEALSDAVNSRNELESRVSRHLRANNIGILTYESGSYVAILPTPSGELRRIRVLWSHETDIPEAHEAAPCCRCRLGLTTR